MKPRAFNTKIITLAQKIILVGQTGLHEGQKSFSEDYRRSEKEKESAISFIAQVLRIRTKKGKLNRSLLGPRIR